MQQAIAKQAEKDIAATGALLSGLEDGLITKPTAETVAVATGQFKQLKTWEAELAKKEKGITGPLNEALKNVRSLFKPMKDRIAALVEQSRSGIDQYNRDVKAALEAKAERLSEKVEEGDISERSAIRRLAKAQAKSNVETIPTRKHKVIKITDESKVPDEYWIIDMPRLRADALGGFTIPGVAVVEEEIIVNR